MKSLLFAATLLLCGCLHSAQGKHEILIHVQSGKDSIRAYTDEERKVVYDPFTGEIVPNKLDDSTSYQQLSH